MTAVAAPSAAMAILLVLGLVLVLHGSCLGGLSRLAGPKPALALAFILAGGGRARRVTSAQVRAYGAVVVCALLMLAGGGWFYRHQRDSLRLDAEAQLEAIARLKVTQIAEWRRERLADAVLVHRTPYAARRALEAMANPGVSTTRYTFTSWLQPLLAKGPYRQALVVDAQLDIRLAYPEGTDEPLCAAERGAAEEALRTREVVVADLHRQADGAPPLLSFMIPLVVRREGDRDNVPAAGISASPLDRGAGVLILQCDAGAVLFPALQSWPLPSRSAETMLLRREGSTALVLNDLRHHPDAALKLEVPLSLPALPATSETPGRQGIVYGLDYRGVEVLGVLKVIPGSPWSMLAKLDTAEALAPWHVRSALILALILGLILLSGGAAAVVWQQSEKAQYRAQFEAETARRQSEERHLAEKVVLLKEIHHRVKNNLQIVTSLLNLQAARTRQPETVAALQDTRNRVHSMALLHEVLYGSPSLARVNIAAYVQELCTYLLRAHRGAALEVTVRQQVLRVGLALEHAVPCGLIISELVSNALKHGIAKGRPGCVTVELQRPTEREFALRVSDDGVGLPTGVDLPSAATLGLQLVANLATQLGGKLVVERAAVGGAAFAVVFPVPADAVIEGEL